MPFRAARRLLAGVISPDILAVFARQYGVAASHQVAAVGMSRSMLYRARRNGVFEDVLPGVVRIASTPLSYRGRAMATQLFTAPDGLLSGWSGGRLAGLRGMPTQTIHVTVADEFRRDAPPWIDIHRTTWWDAEPWSIDAFVVASPMRILFGLAQAFNQHRFDRAAEDAWHLGLITPTSAADYLTRHRCRGKDGVSKIERWLDRCDGQERPAQSNLERSLLEEFERIGLQRPVRQHPLVLPSGELIHLDIAWPAIRLAVEPGSSWFHGGDLRQRRDQGRDRACAELGWLIIRFDETMRDDLNAAAVQVARVHARRTADHRTPPSLPPPKFS